MAFNAIISGAKALASDVQQIIDALSGTSGAGQPISLTQLNDSSNYALDVRNLDSSNGYVARFRDEANNVIATLTRSAITLGKKIIATLGSYAAGADMFSLTATWNAAADTFNAIKVNITNTASASASRLLSLQVGGAEKFGVGMDGLIYGPAWTSFNPTMTQGVALTITVTYARYIIIGKTAIVQIKIVINSAGTATNVIGIESIPAAIAPKQIGTTLICGSGIYYDNGSGIYLVAVDSNSASTFAFYSNNATALFGSNPAVTAASGDEVSIVCSYEIA